MNSRRVINIFSPSYNQTYSGGINQPYNFQLYYESVCFQQYMAGQCIITNNIWMCAELTLSLCVEVIRKYLLSWIYINFRLPKPVSTWNIYISKYMWNQVNRTIRPLEQTQFHHNKRVCAPYFIQTILSGSSNNFVSVFFFLYFHVLGSKCTNFN